MSADRIDAALGRWNEQGKAECARREATKRSGAETRSATAHRVRKAEGLARSACADRPPSLQFDLEPHRECGHLAPSPHEFGRSVTVAGILEVDATVTS